MTDKEAARISKFMSYVLRHQPQEAGLELDGAGWGSVDQLLTGMASNRHRIHRKQLDYIVTTDSKQRYEFSEDGTKIRASQGHSIDIDLDYTATEPPDELYHGTASRFLNSIKTKGLEKMQRHHVHLSAEIEPTTQVGGRHGKPILLIIRAKDMHNDGHEFFISTNGVWLTEHVPPEYVSEGTIA